MLASRISYVGELGWELYVPMEQGARVWDLLHEAGEPDGAVPVGIGVYGTTGRLEKGYRAYGFELDGERTIIEAGMARPKVKKADFVGREAYLAQRDSAPQSVLCTMTVDDHTSASGGRRYMLGGEPILTRDGGVLTDGHGHHPYVTSAGSAPSLGAHVLMAYLPPDQAVVGNAARRVLHGGALPGDRPEQRRHAAVRPRPTSGSGADMTDVLVCIKRVPDAAGEVLLTADEQGVDARFVGFTVSEHENCAVELAVRIASDTGGTATVLTLGPEEAVEQLRTALGVGCSAAVLIEADPAGFGPADIAREIAAVVDAHAAEGRTYDLVLLGNDAADTGDFQVGIRLAYALGRPVVNGVRTVEVDPDEGTTGVATAQVAGPDGVETYAVPLPAVVTVLEGGVEPRYPTITGRMKAKKAKVEVVAPQREPRGSGRVRLTLPPAQPSDGRGAR